MTNMDQSLFALLVFLFFAVVAPLVTFGILAVAESFSMRRRSNKRKRRGSSVPIPRQST